MKTMTTRLLALLLAIATVISLMPATFAAKAEEPVLQLASTSKVLTEDDYADIDALFDELDDMESRPATKGTTQTDKADAAYDMILASDNYVEGSIERNGNTITWFTTEGIRCIYDPYMREKKASMDSSLAENVTVNEPAATKGGSPSSTDVYLVAPYYGQDSSFTDQYKNEATSIASAIGDTDGYTLYSGTAATVDKVATAISNGAVVIFDSHGTTDYSNGEDYVTGANNSYLCLTTNSGVTTADYNDGCMYGSGYAYINGETISNHMTSDSPGGIVWMAICLGMATNTLCEPMRDRGVEVVYGYSQSVSFTGDYKYEATFWDEMIAGSTVASAISTMKSTHGYWDPAYSSYTLSTARSNYIAFPVVVSDEDSHPGQRSSSSYGACSYQTVNSTYTLFGDSSSSSGSTDSGSTDSGSTDSGSTDTDTSSYYTMTFSVNGDTSAISPMTAESFTLPTPASFSGYTFAGWATSAVTTATTTKPTLYTAGNTYTISANITMYAIYSYTSGSSTYYTSKPSTSSSSSGSDSSSSSSSSNTIADGQYVIAAKVGSTYYAMSSTFSSKISGTAITVTNGTVTSANASGYALTIKSNGSYYTISNGSKYLKYSSSTNFTSSSSSYNWIISSGTNGTYRITASTSTSRGIIFQKSYTRFGAYSVSNASSGSTSYYDVELLPISDSSSSSSSSSSSKYTISFKTPTGVTEISSQEGTSVTLPTPSGTPSYAPSNVEFIGWAKESVDNSTTKPTTYAAGNSYTVSADTTYYAVYSYGGNGDVTFTMYDGTNSLYIGDSIIIVASSFDYAMSKTLNANSRKAVAVTKNSDNTITLPSDSDVAIFTVGYGVNGSSSSGQISFKDDSGYLTTSSDTNNYMPTSSSLTAEGSFTFSLNASLNIKLTAQGQYSRKIMRYNKSSKLFSCYENSSTKNAIKIYIMTDAGTSDVTYTTEFAVKRTHTDVTSTTTPATCSENGFITTVCNECGVVVSVEVLPATGHSYVDGVCACGAAEPNTDGCVFADDLTIFNKSLSLQSYVAFNFLVEDSVLENYDSCYAVFQRDDAVGGLTTEVCEAQAYGDSYLQFEYKIYSYQMADNLTVTLYAQKDGITYVGETYSSSVRNYAMSKVEASDDDAFKTVIANLLTYGANAQIYASYRTDDLANKNLGEYASYVTTSLPSVENKASSTSNGLTGVTLKQNALGIASSVQLQFVAQISESYTAEDLYAVVSWERNGETMTKEIDGSSFVASSSGAYYTVVFEDLAANEGRTPVTVTIYEKSSKEAVSESWTFSIESYVASRQASTNAAVVTVLNSMMNFYDSAAAYFNN